MKNNDCRMIPAEEKQCVWMTTGVISYKLCTRDYLCEECVFDKVMRNEAAIAAGRPAPAAGSPAASLPDEPALQVRGALFYHQHHCWAQVETPDQVQIGIDGILANLVGQIKAVALPRVGEVVVQGQCFAHIITARHIVPLIAPLTGSVHAVNERLKETPGLLVNDSWEGGWLVEIEPENLEHGLRTLLSGKKALDWYRKRSREVLETSASMLSRNVAELGTTLQDGGEKVDSLADALNSEQYYQILESLSRAEDPA